MSKKTLFWILAVLITIGTGYYQRKTGPSHPKKVKVSLNDNQYSFNMPRSSEGTADCPVSIEVQDTSLQGEILFRRYPTSDPWEKTSFTFKDKKIVAFLPNQPPAGKLEYYIILYQDGKYVEIAKETPVTIRYTGDVPALVLIPHILFMFAAMMLSNLVGLFILGKIDRYKFYMKLTFIILIIGGFILGPIMQKYAFGKFWTGFPLGFDLTDNKTLIAVVIWLFALLGNIKKDRPSLALGAAIVMLIVYLIPHSLLGSELDYSSGNVVTGFINKLFLLF